MQKLADSMGKDGLWTFLNFGKIFKILSFIYGKLLSLQKRML